MPSRSQLNFRGWPRRSSLQFQAIKPPSWPRQQLPSRPPSPVFLDPIHQLLLFNPTSLSSTAGTAQPAVFFPPAMGSSRTAGGCFSSCRLLICSFCLASNRSIVPHPWSQITWLQLLCWLLPARSCNSSGQVRCSTGPPGDLLLHLAHNMLVHVRIVLSLPLHWRQVTRRRIKEHGVYLGLMASEKWKRPTNNTT
jgi:hypothetical protein